MFTPTPVLLQKTSCATARGSHKNHNYKADRQREKDKTFHLLQSGAHPAGLWLLPCVGQEHRCLGGDQQNIITQTKPGSRWQLQSQHSNEKALPDSSQLWHNFLDPPTCSSLHHFRCFLITRFRSDARSSSSGRTCSPPTEILDSLLVLKTFNIIVIIYKEPWKTMKINKIILIDLIWLL